MKTLLQKEVDFVLKLEHEELSEFKDLTKKTLTEIERTKAEMKIEQRIQLNLGFVHYKLDKIHTTVGEIVNLLHEKDSDFDINHRIKSIINDLVDLESYFLPTIRDNIDKLEKEENRKVVSQMKEDLSKYEEIIKNLKRVFSLTNFSLEDIKDIHQKSLRKYKVKK